MVPARRTHQRSIVNGSRVTHARVEPLESRTLLTVSTFEIDPALSSVRLSGKAFGISLDEQFDGSLRAAYQGSIIADVTGTTIAFLGNSAITAQSKGTPDPGDSPANYAGEADTGKIIKIHLGDVVIRGLVLDLTSEPLTIDTGGSFASTGESFEVKAGTLSYDTRVGEGDEDLSNNDVNNTTKTASTVVTVGAITTLTIPINVKYTYSDATLTLKGQIVATSTGTSPFADLSGSTTPGGDFDKEFVVGTDTSVAAADATTTVTDSDDATLASGVVTLTNKPDGSSESLSVTTTGTGITSSYNNGTGVLTLTGNASTANYAQVLSTLKYNNAAGSPTVGSRTITVVLNDGTEVGPASTSTVLVTSPNLVILGTGGAKTVTFTEPDGTLGTLSYRGVGTATLLFSGATDQLVKKTALTLVGTPSFVSASLADTTLLSRLTVSKAAGGDGFITLRNITGGADVGTLGGTKAIFAGVTTVTGLLAKVDARAVTGAAFTATGMGKLTVVNGITNSTITLTGATGLLGGPTLLGISAKGAITGSKVDVAGNIASITALQLIDSQIYAGRFGTDLFPDTAADLPNEVTIAKVTLGKRGIVGFGNSVIAANNLGKMTLGTVDTDNGGTVFGLTADFITSLTAKDAELDSLSLKKLDTADGTAAALAITDFTSGDFRLRLV